MEIRITVLHRAWRLRSVWHPTLVLLISFLLSIPTSAFAQLFSPQEDIYRSRISEFFYQRSTRDILKPVKLLGLVNKPGLYHIPESTTLTGLLAISGGPTPDANVSKIVVARKDGTIEKRDLMEIVEDRNDVLLKDGDTVIVPRKREYLSSSLATTLIALASIVTAALTVHTATKD